MSNGPVSEQKYAKPEEKQGNKQVIVSVNKSKKYKQWGHIIAYFPNSAMGVNIRK